MDDGGGREKVGWCSFPFSKEAWKIEGGHRTEERSGKHGGRWKAVKRMPGVGRVEMVAGGKGKREGMERKPNGRVGKYGRGRWTLKVEMWQREEKDERVAKKILQNLGKADKTTDEIFDDYVHNFNKQHNGACRLQKELSNYLRCIRATQTASKNLFDTVNEMYEVEWNGRDLLVVQSQTLELLWADYAQKLNEQVLLPLTNYMQQFPEVKEIRRWALPLDSGVEEDPVKEVRGHVKVENKIEKRGRKLLDYDSHRHQYESQLNNPKRRDETKILKTKEQLEEARQLYEVLNGELHDELPALYDSRIPFLISNLQTVCAAETVFHNECAKAFQELEVVVEKLNKASRSGKYNVKRHAPRSPRAPAQIPSRSASQEEQEEEEAEEGQEEEGGATREPPKR
ncbi:unnamed protein product [Cyprideis torosa]|uniref:Uncharacterized protein n=1 Tax=Cyprideis torosa TaxID=163714 RepID=A0A7R8ZLD7_9CRUS|nr:unnamed protein product [Cyprideis torosa]CAG0882043.1 unnamed protein product [Cyprideis torosa]